jgi:hypothetical protein
MQATQPRPFLRGRITADRLLHAPLPQLFEECGVDVEPSSITDATFTGALVVTTDGGVVFAQPPGRPAAEWEITARAMLGWMLNVPLPDLPEPFQLTEV